MDDGTTHEGYGIGELADAAGVTRRTVRYYIQQGLLSSPVGLGRGAFYTEAHLARLRRVKQLQEEGHAIGAIREALRDEAPVEPEVAERLGERQDGGAAPRATDRPSGGPEPRAPDGRPPPIESWARLAIADGVELLVRIDRLNRLPMTLLTEVSAALRHACGEPDPG